MIVRPSRSEHVFFKAAEDVGSLKIGEEETEVYAHDILCAPYNSVAKLILAGDDGTSAAKGALL